jgi:hypothetical protein
LVDFGFSGSFFSELQKAVTQCYRAGSFFLDCISEKRYKVMTLVLKLLEIYFEEFKFSSHQHFLFSLDLVRYFCSFDHSLKPLHLND